MSFLPPLDINVFRFVPFNGIHFYLPAIYICVIFSFPLLNLRATVNKDI
jgi:hypothetical protein